MHIEEAFENISSRKYCAYIIKLVNCAKGNNISKYNYTLLLYRTKYYCCIIV